MLIFLVNKLPEHAYLQTVLLEDVFRAIRSSISPAPSQILLKVDIEQFECRAFLGSPELLIQPQKIPVIAVIMEWTFLKDDGTYSEQCSKRKVRELGKLFLNNGYTPFRVWDDFSVESGFPLLTKLDTSKFGVEWKCNVAWLENSIITDVKSVMNILAFDFI